MAPKHLGLDKLPNELILHCVQFMDTNTRECFAATSKGMAELLKSFERSLSIFRTNLFVSPPTGNILSSASHKRAVLPYGTFELVRELERREGRYEFLMHNCPIKCAIACPPWLPPLSPLQQYRLGTILERSLRQLDQISDIAAHEKYPPIKSESYGAILGGVFSRPSALLPSEAEEYTHNPLTRPHARPEQIKYIQSLSPEDLTGLVYLVDILGFTLTCSCSRYRVERKTVTEECILRHGPWFVYARISRNTTLLQMSEFMISAGIAELREWEAGKIQGPPGLKMTMTRLFNQKILNGSNRDGSDQDYAKVMECLVLGDDKKGTRGNTQVSTSGDADAIDTVKRLHFSSAPVKGRHSFNTAPITSP
ncbi:hypothetical protein F4808DRAFT_455187 [Astrocystis sublimbata]|nr:hypothetical protein F4808DRAFT_455187 [Astrocystis sublimbata]